VCGLCGELRFDGEAGDVAAVGRMNDSMETRGPDGCGVWARGPLALGHRRLTIIDLSAAGGQPMVDSDLGLTVAFNGCIYNYRELREELQALDYRFFSHSDTEVILKAYHRWGTACVEKFKGMFAFAISERDTGRLVLGRDRLGIKPLYVDQTPQRLRFASTLPALVAAGGVDTSIDPVALHHYMSFHSVVPAPLTILNGVRKLPPATVRVVERDGTSTDTVYWRPAFERSEAYAGMTEDDWQEALLGSLRTAVERRMVADVPIGVLLSGGIDSSLVVALLAESGQTGLNTFSIGFSSAGGESGDEFEYSDIIANHFGTNHRQIRIPDSALLPGVGAAVAAMSEPMVSHDCVAFYLLSQEVARHVTVVQSGQGADEILGGYDWYPPLAQVPRADALGAYASVFFDRPDSAVRRLVDPGHLTAGNPSLDFVREHFAVPGAQESVDAALRIDSTVMLVDDPVKRVDNMTMAWGPGSRSWTTTSSSSPPPARRRSSSPTAARGCSRRRAASCCPPP
jgi:asparagine synthase (glutamine-hydrolysing)